MQQPDKPGGNLNRPVVGNLGTCVVKVKPPCLLAGTRGGGLPPGKKQNTQLLTENVAHAPFLRIPFLVGISAAASL